MGRPSGVQRSAQQEIRSLSNTKGEFPLAYVAIPEARAAGQAARSYLNETTSRILTEDSHRFSLLDRYNITGNYT